MTEFKETEVPPALEKFIRKQIEEKIYTRYPQFIKCINHLNEIKWLTPIEISEQHEFYPLVETNFEKIKNLFTRTTKKLPKFDWMDGYTKDLKSIIIQDAQSRLKEYEEKKQILQENFSDFSEKEKQAKVIIDEYRANPEYKLYKNYIGEKRWLTSEEFETEEDFSEEVLTTKQKILLASKWSILFILLIVIVYSTINYFAAEGNSRGYVKIKTNEKHGDLYVDENHIFGYSNGRFLSLKTGVHTFVYRKAGFDTKPLFHQLNIIDHDTIEIEFVLNQKVIEQQGVVKINSPVYDAKIFIDDKFYGIAQRDSLIILSPGTYRISLKKENYQFVPFTSDVSILQNDTINISFSYKSIESNKSASSSVSNGFIEVKSNIPGAKIFLDGKETDYESNYILSKVSLGNHFISLKKEGYKIYPEEIMIALTKQNSSKEANFILTRNAYPVNIETQPVKGRIFINGREVGTGSWRGSLAGGDHKISFSKENFYKTPSESLITVTEESFTDFIFFYKTDFSIVFSPHGILPNNKLGSIQLGYISSDDNSFHSDPNNAPEIKRVNEIKESIWQLGYAFTYRNPPENDAVLFNFTIPAEISLRENINLKIWGYRTDDTYPFEFTQTSQIRISVNSVVIKNKYKPYYALTKANESTYEQLPISNLLRHGRNSIVISTCPANTEYYALWKIAIE